MISPFTQTDFSAARDYFKAHLSVGDYYSQKQAGIGQWFGQGAARLNLGKNVSEKAFSALCEGNDPNTGEWLTVRRNTVRKEGGKLVANRRAFQDWTISPPKSVSLVALLHDPRIIEAHDRCVRAVLRELETFAEVRIRKDGNTDGIRPTGNLVAACFRHDTSRELDPQLHTHCVVFNATFDPVESRWKALQTHGMFKAQRFASSIYDHELSRELHALGYRTRPAGKSFEIDGVAPDVLDRFSKRRRQIDVEAAKFMAREGPPANEKDLRERVAHDKRRRKIKEATAETLRKTWLGQLTAAERKALESLRIGAVSNPVPEVGSSELLAWAERHVFERHSVAAQHELLAAALIRGRGQSISLPGLRDAMKEMPTVFFLDHGAVTSRELVRLEMEVDMIARKGVRGHRPLNGTFTPDEGLSEEQRRAVSRIMQSRSFITLFRGAAGTGKSTSLREVQRGLLAAHHPVVVLAPQRQQVLDLESDGLPANTLAKFLTDPRLEPNTVVVLDESGQVGIRDMHRLVTLSRESRARLILSGDTRQHGAVAASDALVLLERYSGVPVARLKSIRRQDPRLFSDRAEKRAISAYRSAVRLASRGRPAAALDALDGLGWVREQTPGEGRRLLARDYLDALERKERALVVAQTWNEVEAVNSTVRAALADAGRLGPGSRLPTFRAVDLTEAEKQDASSYPKSGAVVFLRNYGRYQRGEICRVQGADSQGITLVKGGRRSRVSYRYADRLNLVEERPLDLAPGDRIQLKMNGRSLDGRPLANGELATVREVAADGRIVIESDRGQRKTLGADHRVFNYGYATTSYGSQGKTVDTVLFSDAGSRLATNQKQFYVTISRGRRRALIFTPDKAALRRAIESDGHRTLAVEGAHAGTRGQYQGQRNSAWNRRLAAEATPSQGQASGMRL
jgi:conjugative relaxase-like TrwC/TraI family protein